MQGVWCLTGLTRTWRKRGARKVTQLGRQFGSYTICEIFSKSWKCFSGEKTQEMEILAIVVL